MAVVTVGALLIGAVLIAVFKGIRPPQPVSVNPTPLHQAVLDCLVPVVCAAAMYGTFRVLDLYLINHLAPPKPLVVLFASGFVIPWFAGLFFAYRAARAANRALRAVGAMEVLVFLLSAGSALLSR